MVIDRDLIREYPYKGEFYEMEVDMRLPPSQREEVRKVILATVCDIQESQRTDTRGNIMASFNIFYPYDREIGTNIKRGMFFQGDFAGLRVNGKVVGVAPSQLGGCLCYVKDLDV